jgi:hypothetical protein
MALFGYAAPPARASGPVASASIEASPRTIRIGGGTLVIWEVKLAPSFGGKVRLECLVTFPAAPGRSPRRKLFFLKERVFENGDSIVGERRISFRPMTTREQTPGEHGLELMLNGAPLASTTLDLRE